MSAADTAAKLAAYDSNQVTSTDALNQALAQYGVPEIRQSVAGMRTTLANTQNAYNNVDPSVTGRTQGSLVTEAQRTKQVSNERAPIAEQITTQGNQLSDQDKTLQDALTQANTTATNKVNDWNTGRQVLQDEYNNEYKSEQDAAAQAEAKREFDAQMAEKVASGSGSGGGASAATTPHAQQRAGGGFNFQAGDGKAISARTYAAQAGISFNSLLQQMASAGDTGAKDALKNGNKSKAWAALTWG